VLSGLAFGGRSALALFAWTALVCLLLVVADGIPDSEQFAGALVVVPRLTTGTDPSADSRVYLTVAVSRSAPSAYLAFLFRMIRSTTALNAGCLPDAMARVTIESEGPVEHMNVHVSGLPPNTDFDFFVIQIPNAPFGLAWFNSPTDALNAGCPGAVTRFNGDHNAGVQALSTRNFPNLEGPLRQLTP
jgi:hypothetical protein